MATMMMVDGEQGLVHLRPEDSVATAFRDKMAMMTKAQERYASIRRVPATTVYGPTIRLDMNAGLMADLPSLKILRRRGRGPVPHRAAVPRPARACPSRGDLASTYSRVIDAAEGKRVVFRTLDIGSDKVAALHEAAGRAEPGAWLARDPCRPRQARA